MGGDSTSLTYRLFGRDVSASKTVKGVGDAADEAGTALQDKLAAGAAAAGLGATAALTSTMSAEQATDKLAAQLGATGDYAADLGAVAGRLYGNAYGESVGEAAEGVRAVLQDGLLPEDATDAQIEAITAKVMSLSTTFDQELGGTTRAVSQMLRTGLATDADQALDILTRGFQQGANKADDLLDTMNEYGTQFRKFGLDGAAATGLLTQGLRAGARDADVVADSIKEFSIRAVDGSETTAAGFKALGLNAKDMAAQIGAGGDTASAALDRTLDALRAIEDPVKREAAAVALFGTQAEDLGQALFALDPSTAVEGLGRISGAAEKVDKTLSDNAGTALESFQRKAMQSFNGAANSAVAWGMQNQSIVVPAIGVIALLAGTVGLVSAATATWTAVQTVASAATKVWAATQWALNIAMSANPIGIVIAIIVALVAAIVIAYKRSETFRRIVQAAGRVAVAAFRGVWQGIKTVGDWIGRLIGWFGGLGGKISRSTAGMWNGIKNSFRAAVNWIIGGWNRLSFTLPSVTVFGKTIGGFTLSTPDIPYLAAGGIVTRPTLAVVGEAGPEAVIPLSRAGGPGLGGEVHIHFHGPVVGSQARREVAAMVAQGLQEAPRGSLPRIPSHAVAR